MELRQLRYFVAVAEELNFRRAAERLHLAQPALSAQIKALEAHMEVRLFERTTRSVRLTAAGRVLLEESRRLLGAAAQAVQSTRKAHHGLAGILRLGMIAPTATPRLARVLRTFHHRFPGVQLALFEQTSTEQLRRLQAGELDVGILRPPIDSEELKWVYAEQTHQVLAMPTGHRLAKKRNLEWKDMDGEGLVMIHPGQQHGFYDAFLAACAGVGAKVHPAQYAHDIQTKMWLISAGFGISTTSATLAEVKRPGLIFRPLPPGLPPVQSVVVWRQADTSPVVQHFLDCFAAPCPQRPEASQDQLPTSKTASVQPTSA